MTSEQSVLCEVRDGVAWLTLNRPGRLNALSTEFFDRLAELLPRLDPARGVRAAVLTGAGRAFSAGGDIKDMEGRPAFALLTGAELDVAQVAERRRLAGIHDVMLRFSQLPIPVIAGINGPIAGAGLSLALACDLRLMSDAASVSTAFAAVGLAGDCGITTLLPEAVGAHRARLLLMRPQRLSAAQALAAGIVDEVVPARDFTAALDRAAADLAAVPPFVPATLKRRLIPRDRLALGLARELDATLDAEVTLEHYQSVRSFLAAAAAGSPAPAAAGPDQATSAAAGGR
jgi:2-(1,2-epoxy-1,2-dihydrophenyl)acetyl-CoA isomerase